MVCLMTVQPCVMLSDLVDDVTFSDSQYEHDGLLNHCWTLTASQTTPHAATIQAVMVKKKK